mgnify:CR=1 FL=1
MGFNLISGVDYLKKYNNKKRGNYKTKKKYHELTFEEKIELYLEQSKENRAILQLWYKRKLNLRGTR